MWQDQIRQIPKAYIVHGVVATWFVVAVLMVVKSTPSAHTDEIREGGTTSDLTVDDSSRDQYRATTDPEREELDREVARIGGQFDELKSAVESVSQRQKALKANDSGKRVASSELSVRRMRALDRFLTENQQRMLQIDSKYGQIVAKSMAINWSAIGSMQRTLAEFDSELAAALQDITNCRLAVAAIEADSDGLPYADKTLGEKLVELEQAEELQFADALRQAKEEADKQSQTLLNEAEGKKRQVEHDLVASKLQLEAVQARDKEADQYIRQLKNDAQGKASQEAINLEADFNRELPRIRYYLAPLLAHGKTQPAYGGNQTYTEASGPVSLTALRRAGSMQEGDAGLGNLALAMTYNNDRGSFSCPRYIGGLISRELKEYVLPARELLSKYQFLLVKKGMLSE